MNGGSIWVVIQKNQKVSNPDPLMDDTLQWLQL